MESRPRKNSLGERISRYVSAYGSCSDSPPPREPAAVSLRELIVLAEHVLFQPYRRRSPARALSLDFDMRLGVHRLVFMHVSVVMHAVAIVRRFRIRMLVGV